jgi:hypothetical protein
MHPAAINDHHDLFAGFAEDRHHLMSILTELLGITVRHNCREDFRRAIRDGTDDTAPHATGDTTPRTVRQPRLPFATFCLFALARASWACPEASTLGCAPPARAGQRKAPQDRCIFREHNDLATTRSGLEGGKCERAVGEISRGRIKATGGAVGAQILFFQAQRTRARPRWPPVCWASTVARSRQLHGEWRAPWCRGS